MVFPGHSTVAAASFCKSKFRLRQSSSQSLLIQLNSNQASAPIDIQYILLAQINGPIVQIIIRVSFFCILRFRNDSVQRFPLIHNSGMTADNRNFLRKILSSTFHRSLSSSGPTYVWYQPEFFFSFWLLSNSRITCFPNSFPSFMWSFWFTTSLSNRKTSGMSSEVIPKWCWREIKNGGNSQTFFTCAIRSEYVLTVQV